MTTQDYGLARRMWHRLAARGPAAITDDDLFEVLDWVANGILDDFPPAVRDALLATLQDASLRGERTTRTLNRYRRAAHDLRQALLDLSRRRRGMSRRTESTPTYALRVSATALLTS